MVFDYARLTDNPYLGCKRSLHLLYPGRTMDPSYANNWKAIPNIDQSQAQTDYNEEKLENSEAWDELQNMVKKQGYFPGPDGTPLKMIAQPPIPPEEATEDLLVPQPPYEELQYASAKNSPFFLREKFDMYGNPLTKRAPPKVPPSQRVLDKSPKRSSLGKSPGKKVYESKPVQYKASKEPFTHFETKSREDKPMGAPPPLTKNPKSNYSILVTLFFVLLVAAVLIGLAILYRKFFHKRRR